MKSSVSLLVIAVLVVSSVFGLVLAGSLGGSSSADTANVQTTSVSVSSVPLTGHITINGTGNGREAGVNTQIPTVSNDGLNLTVYLTSRNLTIGQNEGMTAAVQDNTSTPLTLNESGFLGVTFTVTESSGSTVYSSGSCGPVPTPAAENGTAPPPQGFQCDVSWQTGALVNGAPIQPGTYEITIVGTAGGPNNTMETVSTTVDVTLSHS